MPISYLVILLFRYCIFYSSKIIGIYSNLNECDYVVVPNESIDKNQNLL